jgi:hypothetical protein
MSVLCPATPHPQCTSKAPQQLVLQLAHMRQCTPLTHDLTLFAIHWLGGHSRSHR